VNWRIVNINFTRSIEHFSFLNYTFYLGERFGYIKEKEVNE